MALYPLVVESAVRTIHADVEKQAGGSSNAGLAQSFIKDDSYSCG